MGDSMEQVYLPVAYEALNVEYTVGKTQKYTELVKYAEKCSWTLKKTIVRLISSPDTCIIMEIELN